MKVEQQSQAGCNQVIQVIGEPFQEYHPLRFWRVDFRLVGSVWQSSWACSASFSSSSSPSATWSSLSSFPLRSFNLRLPVGGWCSVRLCLKASRIAHSLKFFFSLRSCSSDSIFSNDSVSGVQLVANCGCWAWVDCNNFSSASWSFFLSDSRLEVPPVAHGGCCTWADCEELAAPATLLASFPISNFGSVLWGLVFVSSDRSSCFTGLSTVVPVLLELSGNDSLSGTVPLLLTATGNLFPSTGCRCWSPGAPPRHLMAVLPASYPHHHKRNAHIMPRRKTLNTAFNEISGVNSTLILQLTSSVEEPYQSFWSEGVSEVNQSILPCLSSF